MRRVVITGLGIVSCLGNDKETVSANLRASRPGIRFNPEYAEMGLRSQVSGSIDLPLEELIDRKIYRFVGHAAAYAYLAMKDAIADSGLDILECTRRYATIVAVRVSSPKDLDASVEPTMTNLDDVEAATSSS